MSVVVRKQPTLESTEESNWQLLLLVVLFVLVVFVAIEVVVHRHESRTLFMELQVLEKERDKLAAQWSRLKLEQGTFLNQVRVERQAKGSLSMRIPKVSEVRIVREQRKVRPVSARLLDSKVVLGD